MAEAFVLTCLGKIGDVLGKVGDHLVAPIQRQFKYLCCFDSNIKELEAHLEMFQRTREGVQLRVNNDRANVRVVDPTVEAWLRCVDDVTSEVEVITQEKPKVKEGCLNGWCPNLKLRYSLSREAVKKTEVIVDLLPAAVSYTQISYSPPPTCMATIPNADSTGFESRRLTMEEIIKTLKHDEINLIGICGMGGAGKTTMVVEVAKRAREDSLFDEVAMAVVGEQPNLNNVRASLADMLGLKTESPIIRADLLRKRLVQNDKKFLVILDDIWAEFDLPDMGLPLEVANKNFKMLYTSRTRDLWHDVRTKKEFPLELLSEDEAWQLFKEKVGDLVDAPELQPIAKQIVHQCGRLPLALVLIGNALSRKSGRNATKDTWEEMLDRLTWTRSTPVDSRLYSRLELSYKYLEDKEAKHLFLLCCLFQENDDIRIEDLARYGFGLSLFDGINEMAKVRRRVLLIVDHLKSCSLLLDSEEKDCVKVHDLVRDMGICIVSRDKWAIVSHGAVSEWPKVTDEHIAISVISEKIKELPEGFTYPNIQFLMLRCCTLEKLPPDFFEGMGKLKVLEVKNFHGILTFQPLKNLTTLALEGFCGMLDNVRVIGDLRSLEILNFRDSEIKELPKEIGRLVKLRLLDLRGTGSLERIPPGVVSRLVCLEELYVIPSRFCYWEGEGQEKGRNTNLKEFESLSNLNTLEIHIKKHIGVPRLPILGELKKYKVPQEGSCDNFIYRMGNSYESRLIINEWNWDTPAGRGGIDTLLRSIDCLILQQGRDDQLQLLLPDGIDSLQQLKYLKVEDCDTPECLANTINSVRQPPNATAVFSILEKLLLEGLHNLREICRGSVQEGSFGQLTEIHINGCERLENLFQQPIVGCLTQLKSLSIWNCDKMEEVISKEQREDVHVATNNRIEFPKLETLELVRLPSLVGFCRGIDQIDLPRLEVLRLQQLSKVNRLFHNNNNLSSNSEQNDNIASFLSLFPEKVSLPNLEVLQVSKLENLERLGHGPLSVGSLFKLRDLSVRDRGKLLCVFPSQLVPMLRNLEELTVECYNLLEVVFELEGVDYNEPNPELLSPLKDVQLRDLPKLIYISKRDPTVFNYIQTLEICDCDRLRYVFAPTVTKSIPQLRELKISRCEMLSRIVAKENGLGESSVDEVEFPQLERLELLDLPNLVSFFPNVNATLEKSTDQLHNTMQPQALFNEKVAFPGLKNLYLEGLQNVSDLWRSEVILPVLEVFEVNGLDNIVKIWDKQSPWVNKNTVVFCKLRDMKVQHCKKLMYLVPSNILPQLQNLQVLCVEGCPNIESVFFENEKEEAADDSTFIIPQLMHLTISDMVNFKSFYSNSTPSNAQSLFTSQVTFPGLENLKLKGLQNVDDIWDSDFPISSLSKLKCLKVEHCVRLRYTFHPSLAGVLVNLQELIINDCLKMEAVVVDWEEVEDGQGRKTYETRFPHFSNLELRGLPNLRSVCHFNQRLELPLLSQMVIWDCPTLDSFSLGPVRAPKLSLRGFSWNG